MANRTALYYFFAVLAVSLILVATSYYAYLTDAYDATTFFVSVALPLVLGSAILSFTKQRILLFAFLAYFWAVVDDAPVFFDSVLTWPEVTRFHPFLPRLYMNVVIHSLTLFFLYLTMRESMKGTIVTPWKVFKVGFLSLIAFVLAYAQNIPLAVIQHIVIGEHLWYPFDVAEKLASIAFLYLAIREGMKSKIITNPVGPV